MAEELQVQTFDHHRQAEGHDEGVDMVGVSYRTIGEELDGKAKHQPGRQRDENGERQRQASAANGGWINRRL